MLTPDEMRALLAQHDEAIRAVVAEMDIRPATVFIPV